MKVRQVLADAPALLEHLCPGVVAVVAARIKSEILVNAPRQVLTASRTGRAV